VVERLGVLADRAPALTDMFFHRLGAVAAARARQLERPLAEPLLAEERFAASAIVAGQVIRQRILDAYDGPMLILKGSEVARRYPDPALRPSHDIDLLADDPAAAQRALLDAGCVVGLERQSAHHELPIAFPDLPLVIEVHRAPKWPAGIPAPPASALLDAAGARDGLGVLPSAHQAVVVAAHAWAERPLGRIMDLADVAVLLDVADRDEATALARAWGLERCWAATVAAVECVIHDAPPPPPLRTWARHTLAVRAPSVPERVIARAAAPFWALPPASAARAAASTLRAAARHAREDGLHAARGGAGHPALNPPSAGMTPAGHRDPAA
jgi:hypothetical protein